MKLNKTAIAVGAVLFSGSVLAEISANIGATSNYLWRGVTQTSDDAAISGGVDYAHEGGFYAGTWVSNVDYNGANAEVDFYGGFGGEFGDGIGFDVGGIYYLYPGADDAGANEDEIDFAEIYGSLSFGMFEGGIAYTIWKEDDDADEHDIYYYISASTEIAPTWSVGATLGYYDFDDGTDYSHGNISVAKDVGDFGEFTFAVSNVFDQDDDLDLDDSAIFTVSWAKTF
jgi:uncharacterized protein (TIGR02001 family)